MHLLCGNSLELLPLGELEELEEVYLNGLRKVSIAKVWCEHVCMFACLLVCTFVSVRV